MIFVLRRLIGFCRALPYRNFIYIYMLVCRANGTLLRLSHFSSSIPVGMAGYKLRYIHLPHLIRMVYDALNNKELGLRL